MTVLLSISLVIWGLFAYDRLPIAALPSYDTPVINVTASLPGASPETMAASVATPLEKQFSTIAGLNLSSSSSSLGNTSITLEFNPDRNIDAAAVDVQAAILRTQRSLPVEMTSLPTYRKVNPADTPILFVALTSDSLSLSQLNDYAENLISPTVSTIDGVAQVQIYGQRRYAVRILAKPEQLAQYNLTMDELANTMRSANANSPIGTLTGERQSLTLQANPQLPNAAAFANLVVTTHNGNILRLQDVATVEDSVESTRTGSWSNGKPAVLLSVLRQPGANTVAVVDAIRKKLPQLTSQMPESIQVRIANDRSISIRDAIHDVKITLLLTIALVVLVIFLFLKHPSATLIPTLSLPISLIGCLGMMQWLGYSLNNISLLAITISVGLVVDDAIVMLENIVRYIEKGLSPLQAALRGSREMVFTILSISLSLVAVFIPIFYMPGIIGQMFHEFAVVVSISILISAAVSLSLIPMLCTKIKHQGNNAPSSWPAERFNQLFQRSLDSYTRTLDWCLRHTKIILGVAISTLFITIFLFMNIPKGFFPTEDIGQIQATLEGPQDISPTSMNILATTAGELVRNDPNVENVLVTTTGNNSGRMFINLKPKNERANMDNVLDQLRKKVNNISGLSIYLTPTQNLRLGGRSSKSRYQYVLQGISGENLAIWAEKLESAMRSDPLFRDVSSDYQPKALQAQIDIHRDQASTLGVSIGDIRTALYSAYGERQVSTIFSNSNSFKVILQDANDNHQNENDLSKISIRSKTGALVPLSSISSVRRTVGPVSINHQGQLQAITLSFNLPSHVPLGEASKKIDRFKNELNIPPSITSAYTGDAAAFESSQSSQIVLLLLALVVIYILLGILYESYIHPLTILAGLPSAAVGALITLKLFGFELTLIATIGILMLIGIVKKNAIMMIDFAIDAERHQQLPPTQAIRQAAILRFRPIMMTTLVAIMGALPIALGLGAGAELRQPLGLAIIGGLVFSQIITLLITPVIYLTLHKWSGTGPLPVPHSY
jgi:HAE1 family hydrophobic/amphiphilic exporter-1